MTNIESAASEPIKVQPTTEEKSVKNKIIDAIESKDKAKALQVYDDLSAYTPLTVDKQGRLIQDGSIIEDSNLVDLIAHDVKKKKGQKLPIAWEIFSTAKKQAYAKKGRLSSSRVGRSKLKDVEDHGGLLRRERARQLRRYRRVIPFDEAKRG